MPSTALFLTREEYVVAAVSLPLFAPLQVFYNSLVQEQNPSRLQHVSVALTSGQRNRALMARAQAAPHTLISPAGSEGTPRGRRLCAASLGVSQAMQKCGAMCTRSQKTRQKAEVRQQQKKDAAELIINFGYFGIRHSIICSQICLPLSSAFGHFTSANATMKS